jgi:deoxyhypusine synthase
MSKKKKSGAGCPMCKGRSQLGGGASIEPLNLPGNESLVDMVDNVFANSGFNGRRLAEACQLFSRMINNETTIALTVAGAMTPIGMSGPIIELIKRGFVDFIISTGANLYHDLHRPFDYPMEQGYFAADDDKLAEKKIARIYDVYIHDDKTLTATDNVVLRAMNAIPTERPMTTTELHHRLGQAVGEIAPHPEKSLVVTAAEYDLPIFTSSPGDSSIAMNLAIGHLMDKRVLFDPCQDILESTAYVRAAKKNGAIELGGGSPKNFYMQTQPMLWQILKDPSNYTGGHDYFIQLTTDSPQWGGLSGATPSEAKSWGKLKPENINHVVVYSCSSITFPIMCQYALVKNKARKPKRLYKQREELVATMIEKCKSNPKAAKLWNTIFKNK